MSSLDPKGKFAVVHFTFTNNDSEKAHVFPLVVKGVSLMTEDGSEHALDERALAMAAILPFVAPGRTASFYVFFDVPKSAHPRSLELKAIDTVVELGR